LLTRGWIAATALLVVALASSLPTPTFAHDGRQASVSAGPALVGMADADFDSLIVPPAPSGAVVLDAAPPAQPAASISAVRTTANARTRGPAARTEASGVRSSAVGTGTWALIVGVNDYPGSANDLDAAVNDAAEVERAMLMLGASRNQVLTLTDGAATGAAIRGGLDWLTANAGPDAVAVVFFAGHAVKQDPGVEALVGTDGARIFDTEIADRLAPLTARKAWIAIAGCYGGGFTEVLAPGRILTGAAPANGLAYENSAFSRSYMVEYMVHRAIVEGRAAQSVQAAFGYAADAVAKDYPGRQPVQFDESGGPLDLRPPSAPPSQPAPSPDSGASPPPTTAPPPPKSSSCWLGVCS
jgi:hypothetical protein